MRALFCDECGALLDPPESVRTEVACTACGCVAPHTIFLNHQVHTVLRTGALGGAGDVAAEDEVRTRASARSPRRTGGHAVPYGSAAPGQDSVLSGCHTARALARGKGHDQLRHGGGQTAARPQACVRTAAMRVRARP
jgi:hypothetical protein